MNYLQYVYMMTIYFVYRTGYERVGGLAQSDRPPSASQNIADQALHHIVRVTSHYP